MPKDSRAKRKRMREAKRRARAAESDEARYARLARDQARHRLARDLQRHKRAQEEDAPEMRAERRARDLQRHKRTREEDAPEMRAERQRKHPSKIDEYNDVSATAARQRKATPNKLSAISVEAAMTGVASSRDEMGGTLHLQCPLCGSFSKSHAHLLIHTANAHPDLLDETAVGRLGNVIIYQSIAQLFHCSRCFFTCKEFPKLYDHLISRHCTNRSQEGEADAGGEAKTGEGGEEEKEASLKRKRSSDREEEEEEGHNEDNSDLPPLPSNKTAEESGVLLFDGSGYRCLICGWKHKLKALGINHVVKRHDIPKTYATWALKQDASTLKPTHTGGGEEEEEKPNLLTQELLREEMEATAKVVRYINGRFVCLTCGWKNKLKGFAISHVARCHKVERPYSCSECDRTFFLPSQLQQHQSSKHRPGRYSCPFCFFRSDFLGGFRRHCSRCNARGEDEEEEAEGYGEGDEGEESDGDHGQESNKCR
ncbi:zinc finger protein 567-like isoform X3 [Lampris incognitus]|uniref:zinc finger protein 567-like isoform X3 n=1 Tax=Lampris incognitus TaxID=2546036 RepID=UPI0024B57A10|nr:zinc finger protein 567-like isoform X3 [Lampris incognitus]XP_056157397.1 zinc finger protein 567-like isoform X3 [Lampris incognitus]